MDNYQAGLAQVRLTSDVVTFTVQDGRLNVLLIKRNDEPFKDKWALPGGFVWEGESTKHTAQRILTDKAGVRNMYLEQLYTFDALGRDPRGHIVSVTYVAWAAPEDLVVKSTSQTQLPTLFPVQDLPQLAFDHEQVIYYARQRLQSKIQYTNAAYSLLPATFSFSQLQSVYEAILGQSVDRRNFRKKFLSLGLIKPTGEKRGGERHRPAELFQFTAREPIELSRWF